MSSRLIDADVVVVGAGPVGATLAALLGQCGVRVFIGDANPSIYPLPRAAHFDHEVMRIFQQLGLTEELQDSITPANRYVFQNQHGDVLLDFDLSAPADTGWQGYMMHQPGIETALRRRLDRDVSVDLRTGVTFQRFENAPDGVVSHWSDEDGPIEVRSRYLVGCDGASSRVRDQAGVGLDDLRFDEPWLVLDLVVDAVNGLPDVNTQYCDPNRPTTYVIMGNNRRRFEFMLKPGEDPAQMIQDEAIDALLRPWNTLGLRSVERKSVYRFHALVAHHWRRDRIFLAGDAAHQMPPFAGQGMCSGVRDAAALAWRLHLALMAPNAEALLDSYQQERDPHVRAITAAAVATGQVVCTLDTGMAAGRDEQMLAAKAAGAPPPDISSPPLQPVFGLPESPCVGVRFFQPSVAVGKGVLRLDDVLGAGAWLIARDGVRLPRTDAPIRLVRTDAPVLGPFRGALERWLADAGQDAVLVRPDRYAFGTGAAEALVHAFEAEAGLETRQVASAAAV